jgi:D-isomer specific 2-hydroxyacid dehydrogenase, catalytic domain
MNDPRPSALQLCPLFPYLEERLSRRFNLVRWFEMAATKQSGWLLEHGAGIRVVVTGGHIGCSNELMTGLPDLGIIAVNGVGVDKVDLDFARHRGVRITSTPGVLTDDVADLAVGLIIGLLREIPAGDAYVRSGHWVNGERPLSRKVTGRRFGADSQVSPVCFSRRPAGARPKIRRAGACLPGRCLDAPPRWGGSPGCSGAARVSGQRGEGLGRGRNCADRSARLRPACRSRSGCFCGRTSGAGEVARQPESRAHAAHCERHC